MNTYQTATEAAADVRAAFKAKGWTPRQVGVRAEYFSLGSSINVTLKDGSIPLHEVKSVAEGKERIHRCEITGEILGGGNRYVNVSLTKEAEALKVRRYIEAVGKAADALKDASDGTLQPIIPGYLLGKGRAPDTWTLWGDSHIAEAWGLPHLALRLALAVEEGRR